MDHNPFSPSPAPPLDDENLLQEILLRLPPKPSSLPRTSLVCKRWRHILSDPRFLRRFREHHQKLLGFFSRNTRDIKTLYTPILYSPDRIPTNHFYMHIPWGWEFMGCRHGLAVGISYRHTVIIWKPLTSQQQHVNFPPGFNFHDDQGNFTVGAAVLRSASDNFPQEHGDRCFSAFKLVLAWHNTELGKAFACTYKSESGAWGDVISTTTTNFISLERPSILVGNALYWLLAGGDILEFDLERLTLAMIEKPADAHVAHPKVDRSFQILRGENNGLGLAVLSVSERSIQLWARNFSCDGVFSWVLQKTIKLEDLFSLPLLEKTQVLILGYDEDTNVIFLSSESYDFMLLLDSMQFRGIGRRKYNVPGTYYPYTDFFTAVMPCEDDIGLGSKKSELYSFVSSLVCRMKKQVIRMFTSFGSKKSEPS